MKKLSITIAGLAIILFSGTALAEEPRTMNINDGDTLTARDNSPGMGKVVLSNLPDIGSLIDVRTDFDDQIVRSGNDL